MSKDDTGVYGLSSLLHSDQQLPSAAAHQGFLLLLKIPVRRLPGLSSLWEEGRWALGTRHLFSVFEDSIRKSSRNLPSGCGMKREMDKQHTEIQGLQGKD